MRAALRRTAFWRRRDAAPEAPGERVFTEHVRALAEGRDPGPRPFAAVEDALRAALRSELRRRGLWEGPPGWLGVAGSERWDVPGALDELVSDAYAFVFVRRLRSLTAQLRVKPNVDGLVFLNLRHFLHERQKEHDPLGSQVFEVLQSAVREAVASGELRVVSGDERVRNETVLAFGAGAPAAVPAADPREVVTGWTGELLPDLVTLRGRRQEEIVQRLRELLPDLLERGIARFRFKELVDLMKADVRARWAAVLERGEGELGVDLDAGEGARRVPLALPDTGFEDRQLFRWLVDCVLDRVEGLDVNEKTRRYLLTLWQYLRIRAADLPGPGPAAADEESTSLRRLSELLDIPRDRLPGLYGTLGRLLEDCRSAARAWRSGPEGRFGEVSA